jgi:hypothetical protein
MSLIKSVRSQIQWLGPVIIIGPLLFSSFIEFGAAQVAPEDAQSTATEFTRLVRAGEALAKAGNYVGAIEHYDRAFALGPPGPGAESSLLTYRAGAYSKLGRSMMRLQITITQ